ncbi:MAG: hypothetical protein IJ651_01350 [Bacteroidales bacterium]|nr:hypothetical protein [Bacteroidales bacterium]
MIKEFLRRRSLKKAASQVPTGLLPLSAVRSAVAFIDVEDPGFDHCKNTIMAFFREQGIKVDIFFFDLRKISKGERLITSITTTVLRKDLNWYDKPSREKTGLLLQGEPDLLISLLPSAHYPLEYLVRSSGARFKVGRDQLSGDVFDLVVKDPADKALSQKEAFDEIVKLLKTIR